MARKLSVSEHLDEVRKRAIIIIIIFSLLAGAAFFFIEPILTYLTTPVGQLVYLSPAELFIVQIKIAVCLAILIEMPFILWHLISFVSGALPRQSLAKLIIWLVSASVLFYAGAAFALFGALPLTMKFFLGLQTTNVTPMLSIDAYISFILLMVFGFGITFLIPIPIILAVQMGIVDVAQLNEWRKYVIIGILIIAAAVTPSPDAFTMGILAVPLWLLFELSALLGWFIERRRK